MTTRPERAIDYLQHILQAIERGSAYIRQVDTFAAFETDVLIQDAVVRNITVIGEAAVKIQHVDPGLGGRYPDIPWKSMQTMRHKVVHDYFEIDLLIVWNTVTDDLPRIAAAINQVLADVGAGDRCVVGRLKRVAWSRRGAARRLRCA